jgi:hypothetical protein
MARKKQGKSGKGSPTSKKTGSTVRIVGHQVYSDITNGSSGTKLFNTVNVLPISPDSLGTEIADLANHYDTYQFQDLYFVYQPADYNLSSLATDSHGTGVANLFSFGYEDDGVPTFTVSYANITSLEHCLVTPVTGYQNRASNILKVKCRRDRWYFCKDNTGNDASSRQTTQGLLFAEAKFSISTSLNWGDIMIYYTVVFKDLCPTQGVSLTGLMREASLGRTPMLEKALLMIRHAAQFGAKQGKLTDEEASVYSNEECAILGITRTIARPIWPKDNAFVNLATALCDDLDEYETWNPLENQKALKEAPCKPNRLRRPAMSVPPV